jgi:hypothetical protein
MAVLDSQHARAVIRALQSRKGFETLSEPEITVLSDRRTQMRTTGVVTIVTNLVFEDGYTNVDGKVIGNAITPQTSPIETGPVLNLVPRVLADGYTIGLSAKAILTEFEGYAEVPTNAPMRHVTVAGEKVDLPNIWPAVQTRSQSANVNLYDNQTLVLSLNQGQAKQMRFGEPDEKREAIVAKQIQDARRKDGERDVIVLVTATIIDRAGSRVHSDDEMPFAQEIPPQPTTTNDDSADFSFPAKPPTNTNGLDRQAVLQASQSRKGVETLAEPEITTSSGHQTQMRATSVMHNAPSSGLPVSKSYPTNGLIWTSAGRQAIMAKLDKIHFDYVSWDNLPLNEVLKQLSQLVKLRDPEHKGINFLVNNGPDLPETPVLAPNVRGCSPTFDPITGLPEGQAPETETHDVGSYLIKMQSLSEVRVADVLDAIVLASDHPLKYSTEDFAVVLSAKGKETPQLFMRTFKIDPSTFCSGLTNFNHQDPGPVGYVTPESSPATPSALARVYFTSLGINFTNLPGKSLFYNERLGYLFVKATEADLDTIGRALQALNQTQPQVHIKTRFYEVPEASLDEFDDFDKYFNTVSPSTGTPMGILPNNTAKEAIKDVQLKKDFEVLAEPEATVLSGRQVQLRATTPVSVVIGLNFSTNFNSNLIW